VSGFAEPRELQVVRLIARTVSRLPAGRHEGIGFRALALILIKTRVKALKCRRAPHEWDVNRGAFAAHLKNIGSPKSLVERSICQGNRNTLRFGQGFRPDRRRTCNETNGVSFTAF
jgi:hypothetical protein